MHDISSKTDSFIAEFDAAIEAHMDWTQRILRCAVLHTSPGEDVLSPVAHTLCRFGRWFLANKDALSETDADIVQRMEFLHQIMHDSIRSICSNVISGVPGQESDLKIFEHSQSELLTLLAKLKTLTLSKAARHDPLTGLPLRHNLESEYLTCLKNAKRNNSQLYIVMIDVDHFKAINDSFGHPVGDIVLRHLATTLKRSLRDNEPLFRFGGEEFLWLMQTSSTNKAKISAQRIVNAISSSPAIISEQQSIPLTVTLGLAQANENEALITVIKRADLALYAGKNDGRNRYVISTQ